MKKLLTACALVGLLCGSANAAQIISFGQLGDINTVTATDNGSVTTISANNAKVDVTQLLGNGPFSDVDFTLNATSIDSVVTVGKALLQHFTGSFCVSTGANCSGTDLLSGSFTDAAFGGKGGPGLVINVNNPPDVLTLMSDVIAPTDLAAPNTFNIGFSNLTPKLHIDGSTIAAFRASVVGDASAGAITVPEPGGIAVLGIGLIGLGIIRHRTRRA